MLEKRPFATGSKPGPDEIDHYLEEQGYYRKHVARDSSSLFRVIAEHVLDVQNYHDQVRQTCASYMELHRKRYAPEVDQNFFNYLAALRKTRTPGSLLELRVLAQIYRKNIILFEPNQSNTQTNERIYVQDDSFDPEPIRIFYSQKDKHFDVIYTLDYVEVLAESQAIVYEILYTNVFKLPDVKYAVERMLHDQKGEVTIPLPDDETKYKTANGEILPFDTPENTCCVLKDPETCHFHNQINFEEVVRKNQGAFTIINRSDDPGRLKIYKPTDGYLYDSTKSCVRQLLDENITPFPYKVAKALDPSIYRNTEFEFWQELRKENRLKWQDVDNAEKYFAPFSPFNPALDETAYIALDDDVKNKYIYVSGKEDECAKKFGYFTGYEHFRPSRDALEQIVMPMHHNQNYNYRSWRGARRYYNNQRYHNHSDDREFQYIEPEPVYTQTPQPVYQDNNGYSYVPYVDPNSPPPFYQAQPMQPQMVQYIPQSPYPQHTLAYQPAPTYNQAQPVYPNFSVPPPPIVTYPPTVANASVNSGVATQKDTSGDYMNLIRENELSSTNINWNPKESIDGNGNDMPLNDMSSLQFFYNLGVRYFFAAGVNRRLENVANHLESLDVQENQVDTTKTDQPPPVPQNTPVTTKGSGGFGPPGNRSHYNNNNNNNQYNYRRAPFSNQNSRNDRDHHHGNSNQKDNNSSNNNKGGRNHYNGFARKEIQFNSNVKNVHKADSSFQKHNNAGQSNQGQNHNNNQTSSNAAPPQDKNNNTLTVNMAQASSASPTGSTESTTYANDQSMPPQNSLPALTIPPPQVQMTYTPHPQYYPQYQMQAYVPAQQQYTVGYQNENGDVVPQPYQPQSYQPIYYAAAPSTPVYYTSPQPVTDQSGTTNDSGVETVNGYVQAYAPPAYAQYMYPPTPYYYPQTPLLQTTPQANAAPIVAVSQNAVVCTESGVTTGKSSTSSGSSPNNTDASGETAEA